MTRITSHPGQVLLEEFMKPHGIKANALGTKLRIAPNRILAISKGKRSITPDTATRLAVYFNTTPEFWINLQMKHDLTKYMASNGETIAREVTPLTEVA